MSLNPYLDHGSLPAIQGVYDKHCDQSLILKSIALHAPQLSSLSLQQAAMLTAKSIAAMSDMPNLSSLTLKNAHGFEPGALAKLSSILNLMHLHLEILEPSNSGSTPAAGSSTAGSATGSTVQLTPSELARLQASDEVGLAKCTRLVSLTAINLARAGALRPVEALLGAIAGSLKPRLAALVLGNMPDLPASVIEVAAGIPSSSFVSLAGCDVAGSADVAKLSMLTGLMQLELAPQLPPATALAALAKGCKRLVSVSMGATPLGPGAPVMSGVSELQMLAVSPVGAAAAGAAAHAASDSGSSISSSLAGMSLRMRPPLQLTGFGRVWPSLKALEISGWGLDAAGVAAIRQLEGLTSLKLVGGSQPGAALQGKLLLPLLDMPELQQLVLLEVTGLTDEWVADAMRGVGAAGGGSFCAVRELTLGAVADGAAADSSAVGAGGKGTAAVTAGTACCPYCAVGGVGDGSQMVTDRGLVRLFACPQLRKLKLVQLQGITLAAVKALARGSSSLAVVEVLRCPAVSAAPPEAAARAAVVAPDRAIDLWVSP
jgi:hypothetical protein